MIKLFSKKLLLLYSAVFFISYGFLWACAGGDWDEFLGSSVYTPEAFVDTMYQPFIASNDMFYEMGYDTEHPQRFNEDVLQDWQAYLSTYDTSLSHLLFSAPLSLVDSVCNLDASDFPSGFALSTFLKQKKSSARYRGFFKWLYFARHNEAYAVSETDYWAYDPVDTAKKATSTQLSNTQLMLKAFEAEKDPFLRQRYVFQLVRDYFFFGHYAEAIAYYKKFGQAFPENTIAARTLSYVAGAYYRQKQYDTANYLYARVFDMNDKLKIVAEYSFHPQEEKDWEASLALCKNAKEQISLWFLAGMYFDESRAIEHIYALDPKSDKLDLLLSRLVNIAEKESAWVYSQATEKMFNPAKGEEQLRNMALVGKIADNGNTAKPYNWEMACAYLYFMAHDFNKAKSYYERALKSTPKNTLAAQQLRMLMLMNKAASLSKISPAIEQELLPEIDWLQHANESAYSKLRSENAYAWLKVLLAMKYNLQGDWMRSELFVHRSDLFTQMDKVKTLKAFLQSSSKTPFEAYCVKNYEIKAEDISEYQAILLSYQDHIKEAIPLMKEGAGEGTELLGNPFNGKIKDCHDCDHMAPQRVKYTKLSLLLKLAEMEGLITEGKDVYNNALLVANAFYNMSHFGNARMFYEGAILGAGHYSPDAIESCFRDMLLSQLQAKKYYQTALKAATNDEQRAKVEYMLLKCLRNESYIQDWFYTKGYNSWDYANIPLGIPYANLENYKHTNYYKEILAECGYFRYYLSKKRR